MKYNYKFRMMINGGGSGPLEDGILDWLTELCHFKVNQEKVDEGSDKYWLTIETENPNSQNFNFRRLSKILGINLPTTHKIICATIEEVDDES